MITITYTALFISITAVWILLRVFFAVRKLKQKKPGGLK